MRVGIAQEGDVHGDVTVPQRYHEMIEEIVLADEVGFSVYGTSEQHFSAPRFTISAPELLYAAIAVQTRRIRIREMCAVMLKWNHPALVAERMATLDILSNGRAELATARSNNLYTLEAFGVEAKDTSRQFDEGMEFLVKAMSEEIVEFHGELWDFPPRPLVPRSIQRPHVPLSMAASSVDSHRKAGERGIGVIAFEGYFGFDYLQSCIDAYRAGLSNGTGMTPARNEMMSIAVVSAFCAETRAEAVRVQRQAALDYFAFMVELYGSLSKHGSYEYLERMDLMKRNVGNIDFLLTETPSVLIGTPDDFIARMRELEERGIDEIVLRLDGVPTEDVKRSIELIGREVIPAVDKTKARA